MRRFQTLSAPGRISGLREYLALLLQMGGCVEYASLLSRYSVTALTGRDGGADPTHPDGHCRQVHARAQPGRQQDHCAGNAEGVVLQCFTNRNFLGGLAGRCCGLHNPVIMRAYAEKLAQACLRMLAHSEWTGISGFGSGD